MKIGFLWKLPDFFLQKYKLSIKLQTTIIKNPLGLLFPSLQMHSEPIPPAAQHRLGHHQTFKLTLEFKLNFCTLIHMRKAHWGDHTHTVSAFSRVSPIYNHLSCHITSQHIFACSGIQLTLHGPSKAARVMLWAIFWDFWLWFLKCKHSHSFCHLTVLFQFWPPSFHWFETGWLSERGVWAKEEGQTHTFPPSRDQPLKKNHKDHNHRVTEWLSWKGPSRSSCSSLWYGQGAFHESRFLKAIPLVLSLYALVKSHNDVYKAALEAISCFLTSICWEHTTYV